MPIVEILRAGNDMARAATRPPRNLERAARGEVHPHKVSARIVFAIERHIESARGGIR